MRIFHKKVFDNYIATTVGVYSDTALNEPMGKVDMIHLGGYTSQVVGTNPALLIYLEHSFDQIYWDQRTGYGPITLSTTQETLFQTYTGPPDTGVAAPFLRVKLVLTGTNPMGFFRIWATGRDFSRRAKSMIEQVSDVSDHLSMPSG